MQVTLLSPRPLGTTPQKASEPNTPAEVGDLFKPTAPIEPDRPEEPGGQGWGHTVAFTTAGLAAGAVSGFMTGAHMGGVWGGIVGGVLNLIPAAALAVAAAIPLSESQAPGIASVGLPLGIFGGGVGLGAYWGATGHWGGPVGLALTGALTGGLLIGIWGYFRSESGHEKKIEAYHKELATYNQAMQRYDQECKTYDKELKTWAERREEKTTSTRIIEGAKRLFLNGIHLKKREQRPHSETEESTFGC